MDRESDCAPGTGRSAQYLRSDTHLGEACLAPTMLPDDTAFRMGRARDAAR